MQLRLLGALAVAAALMGTVALAPRSTEAAQPQRPGLMLPVTGPLAGGGTFTGVATITNLAVSNGQVLVSGVLNGTVTAALGGATPIVNQAFTVPASLLNPGGGRCGILFLDLGPIFLNLLGLEVDLSQITLNIDAVPGPGNLLGNLLCGVARLLDRGGPLSALQGLLNRINALLG